MMTTALSLLIVLVPLQMLIGDQHGLNTRKYQPAKLAGIEALWNTGSELPLTLFALPDQNREQNNSLVRIRDDRHFHDIAAVDRPPKPKQRRNQLFCSSLAARLFGSAGVTPSNAFDRTVRVALFH